MITFENVSKLYNKTEAIHDFSLEVASGEILVLLGSSGCGKSTLLKMINRMEKLSAGRILIDGEDISHMNPVHLRRSIGYVMQDGGLLPHRTVLENIATVPRLQGDSKREALNKAYNLLATVGLDNSLADRYPAQLSGGQKQRVGVARALASNPHILLMDEPFGALDPLVRRELQDELLRLQKDLHKTIIFVSHDVDEALRVADRIAVLRPAHSSQEPNGQIAALGSPSNLLTHYYSDFVSDFLGMTHGQRTLRTTTVDGQHLVTDTTGRIVGVLEK
ncbi:ABC transporter ATP-binding protein [Alloscardovia omnicolens]|uniref:ABC transporter ATP-binding protein n=1 Tax=Alloscardovia omnicolens TaxID=419015 RepID=UPI003A750A27